MNKGRILIVEDDSDLLRAFSRIISKEGYEVLEAATGGEGLRICNEDHPDLVLLDATLPDASGVDLCRQIKADDNLTSSFVLMISGQRTSPEHLAEGLEAGADGYLTKPVEPKVLLAHVRALLRIKKAEYDLTESREQYRRLAQELKETNHRLEEYNRLKAEFIANMSHELRTPLTAIIGFAQLIQLRPPSAPVPRECTVAFERILRNGKHLLALIDEVLDIAKIEAGRLKIHREHFDIADLTQSAFQEMQALAQQKSLEYRLNIPREMPLAFSDPLRLRQVMINLLSNAIKFTQSGRVEVELIPRSDKEFQFIVRDTGIGIEEKAVGIIFDRFRQVDGKLTRIAGGTGLGLSIVKQIVTLLGGRIDVSSKLGEGSVFTVTLPLVTQETPAIVAGNTAGNGSSPTLSKPPISDEWENEVDSSVSEEEPDKRPLVLIVEDDADMANLLSETISKADYRVRVASSGIEGLNLARELDLSAILLDVMMPEMDGWKVLQALKAEADTAQIPVIVCSIVDNRPLGYRLGASNYLIKPIEPQQLLSALQSVGTEGTNAEGEGYILVIDDEHGIRELLTAALKKAGFNARSAVSGETAIKMVLQSPPKAIISDLMMPGGMSGYELIARMRSNPETENIPIVVVTGKDMTSEDRRFVIGEIARVIRKGDLLMSDLETRLRQTLEEIGVNPTSGKDFVN
jgi:DNA-binding response OmpR family regulator/two-component sensor histidine kinase